MKPNTREKLLHQGEMLFSRNGFYGTSIQDVAAQLNISKQALLHHFPSKERLYGAVLEQAAEHLNDCVQQAKASSQQADQQLLSLFTALLNAQGRLLRVVVLLMRELLDNPARAETAHKWYLRPFLNAVVEIVVQGQQQGLFAGVLPLPFIYHLLGATQYYLVSQPTLNKLYNEQECRDHQQQQLMLITNWIHFRPPQSQPSV